MKSKSIFFIGPLPPPIHGFSVINAYMLSSLKDSADEVIVCDMAPRSLFSLVCRWFNFLMAVFLNFSTDRKIVYLAVSGGIRQLVDLAFALPSKWLGFNFFVHHHSFAYLNTKPWFSRLTFSFLRTATHITLCPAMARLLCEKYGISPERVRVLSNAVFLECSTNSWDPAPSSCLTLGFMSNITADKGIFSFFDALDGLSAKQIPFTALIAGPVSPEIKTQFETRLASSARVSHVGPVYGDAKNEFLGKLDLLLFPTLYANEAEPVTLWEAMSHGVPVVALQRGCIQGIVPADAGRVVLDPSDFTSAVEEEVLAMYRAPELLSSRRIAARAAFESAQTESKTVLKNLLDEITGRSGKALQQ